MNKHYFLLGVTVIDTRCIGLSYAIIKHQIWVSVISMCSLHSLSFLSTVHVVLVETNVNCQWHKCHCLIITPHSHPTVFICDSPWPFTQVPFHSLDLLCFPTMIITFILTCLTINLLVIFCQSMLLDIFFSLAVVHNIAAIVPSWVIHYWLYIE